MPTVSSSTAAEPRKPPPLTVTLPDSPAVPEPYRDRPYEIRGWLLNEGSCNPKLHRSDIDGRYKTWGLSLSPAKTSGRNLCPSSTAGCRRACLYFQGHARLFPSIRAARLAKSLAFIEHRDWFEARLRWELSRVVDWAARAGVVPVVRPNVVSDVPWERVFPWMFGEFPAVQHYDYSKHFPRMMRFVQGNLPPNYHLTFSRSEDNEAECREVLSAGGTVAVVFRNKSFPARYLGAPVIDGDEHDLRFLDPKGVVVGLSAKGTAKEDESGFVVETRDRRVPLL